MANKVPHKQLSRPPFGKKDCGRSVVFVKDEIIVSPAGDYYIYKYNTKSNLWTKHKFGINNKITNRPCKFTNHSMCSSNDQKQLYIYHGLWPKMLIIMDIETMKVIKTIDNIIDTERYPSIISDPSNNNIIHVIGGMLNKRHFTVNIKNGTITRIHTFDCIGHFGLQGGIIVNISNDNIIYIHANLEYINQYNITTKKWANLNVKIPFTQDVHGHGYILTKDKKYIIIIGGAEYGAESYASSDIYIYNITNQTIMKSNIISPISGWVAATITTANNIHLFQSNKYDGYRYVIPLNSLIKNEMTQYKLESENPNDTQTAPNQGQKEEKKEEKYDKLKTETNKEKQSDMSAFIEWLRGNDKLQQCYDTFMDKDIDEWEIIKNISDNELKEIGISFGNRKRILLKIKEIQNKKPYTINIRPKYDSSDDEKVTQDSDNPMTISSFDNQINQLSNIIKNHFNFMAKQEKTVNVMINGSGQQKNKLKNAKIKALDTEKKLLTEIMNISSLNDFLTNIILIENLFNSQYTKQEKLKQQNARHKYAKNIAIYEKKSKPICNASSFVDLLFAAYTDITAFKDWLKILQNECNKSNIKMLSKPEAKQKNIERAFYKTFYVYSINYGNKAHQRLTDVLRCSLVFDNFDDLYQCFSIIEKLTRENGGILRAKDRFDPNEITFGYRDLLININCPQSQVPIVCEVQLHHQLFYKHKSISHAMYKKARLFDDKYGNNNKAYQYADKYIRKNVGNKQYEYVDTKKNETDPVQLLKQWKLSQYADILIEEEGYDDPAYWKDISIEELKQMGFKSGHAKKFVAKAVCL